MAGDRAGSTTTACYIEKEKVFRPFQGTSSLASSSNTLKAILGEQSAANKMHVCGAPSNHEARLSVQQK